MPEVNFGLKFLFMLVGIGALGLLIAVALLILVPVPTELLGLGYAVMAFTLAVGIAALTDSQITSLHRKIDELTGVVKQMKETAVQNPPEEDE